MARVPPDYEKRSHRRYPVRGALAGHFLSQLSSAPDLEKPFQGTLEDISRGGFGVRTEQAVSVLSPIRCEVRLDNLPVSIPTLVQVRWVEKSPTGQGGRIGLHFLL